jgi:rod shape-determining protein MreC
VIYRRAGRGRILLLVFLALSVLIITIDFRQNHRLLEAVRDGAIEIVAPIQRGFTAVFRPVGNFFSSLSDLAGLRTENAALKEELADTRAEAEQVERLKEENIILNNLLDLDPHWAAGERVTATVIGDVPSNYVFGVLIDKGSNDGIQPEMAVVDLGKGLVGKVVQVTGNTSTVLLLTDPQAAAGAMIKDEGETGVVRGNGGAQLLTLDFISTKAKAKPGAMVVTSGYDEGIFPRGIPIGEISTSGADSGALQQEIEITPFVDFDSLQFVQILIDTGRVDAPEPSPTDEDP